MKRSYFQCILVLGIIIIGFFAIAIRIDIIEKGQNQIASIDNLVGESLVDDGQKKKSSKILESSSTKSNQDYNSEKVENSFFDKLYRIKRYKKNILEVNNKKTKFYDEVGSGFHVEYSIDDNRLITKAQVGDYNIYSYEYDESEKKWFSNLLFYKYSNSWTLEKRVKIMEFFRGLQFTKDEDVFIVLFASRIAAFTLENFLETVLMSIESDYYYSTAHLAENGRYLLAVIAPQKGSGGVRYHLYDFKTKESIILRRGINQISSIIKISNSPISIPLLTDEGRIMIKIVSA